MPLDQLYLPIHVGKNGKSELGYIGDDSGENISHKNKSYCELTGLYWMWKNMEADSLGVAHYRRHFTASSFLYRLSHKKEDCVLSYVEAEQLLSKNNIIVPKKRHYLIETLYTHYAHTHYIEQLDLTREIIKKNYKDYLKYFDVVMKQRSGHMFNMFVMKKEQLDLYCEWLFGILFLLEEQIKMPELSQFQGRFYGRISEIIFNCWIMYQKEVCNVSVCEIGYMHMEKTNWIKKGYSFLAAKFLDRKYRGSL